MKKILMVISALTILKEGDQGEQHQINSLTITSHA